MYGKMWKNIFKIIGLVFIGVLFLNGCGSKVKIQKQTRFLMDTYCTIQVPGDVNVLKTIEAAFDRMEEVNKHFNVLDSSNALYRFNQNSEPIQDKEIIDLVKTSIQVSRESGGAFDITIYPLVKLWGFFSGSAHLPSKKEIETYLPRIGYANIIIKNNRLTKGKKDIQLDLGGIAKGYAIKEALNVLKAAQIKSALIDAGGDIYALGNLNGKPWKVGIRNPRGEGVIGVLEVSDIAVVTSGDYERFFKVDSVRYHHLLDPKTGYPARGLTSVTVISPDPVLADAWSTALFIMGKDRGMALVEGKSDIKTLMVTTEGEIISSSDLE